MCLESLSVRGVGGHIRAPLQTNQEGPWTKPYGACCDQVDKLPLGLSSFPVPCLLFTVSPWDRGRCHPPHSDFPSPVLKPSPALRQSSYSVLCLLCACESSCPGAHWPLQGLAMLLLGMEVEGDRMAVPSPTVYPLLARPLILYMALAHWARSLVWSHCPC